jgi:hypothetical protein
VCYKAWSELDKERHNVRLFAVVAGIYKVGVIETSDILRKM